MIDEQRFGHTQTLSPKPIGLRHDTFMVGFANVPLRSKPATTFHSGGGRYDQERIPALQPEELRHRCEDCYSEDKLAQQAQRLRVFNIRGRERHIQDRGLHTEETQGVVMYA